MEAEEQLGAPVTPHGRQGLGCVTGLTLTPFARTSERSLELPQGRRFLASRPQPLPFNFTQDLASPPEGLWSRMHASAHCHRQLFLRLRSVCPQNITRESSVSAAWCEHWEDQEK